MTSARRLRRVRLAVLGAVACVLTLSFASLAVGPASADSYVQISGSGSTWSENALNQWIADVTQYGMRVNYAGTGYVVGSVAYQYTSSIVYAFGGGADYDLTDHFALKADYQMQRWLTPVTTSGAAYPQAISFGIVYRINIGRLPIGKQR